MRMMKAEAAAGMWLDGGETSRGESRHRVPGARTENGKNDKLYGVKNPLIRKAVAGIIIFFLCY